ncbi:MAG: preprotein translocase subunit SecG [Planctomycetaceae bacterium]|nr:preprotein translocase subunit SecG [Planctomycetaceae bacterium]
MGILTAILNTLSILVSLFLICLVLIQRGKGGGLAGAFGGVGGSSAFGTKAGDTFTRITVITAAVWILLLMLLVIITNRRPTSAWGADTPSSVSKEAGSSRGKGKATGKATEPASGSTSAAASPRPVETPASPEKAPAIPRDASFPPTPKSP